MLKTNLFVFCSVQLLMSSAVAFSADPAIKDNTPKIEFVLVKGGCYQMGDVFGGGNKDEAPAHEVCVKDFYLGKYEVTQDQWERVMGDNPSEFKQCGENCPVDSVSWDMAQEFIKKLNTMTKKKHRLPTEAEWEYAARSGGKNEKWPGTNSEDKLVDYAWYDKNSEETTHPAGLKMPNALGLYDMAGNVREWCQDWYDDAFYAKSPKDNPEPTVGHVPVKTDPPQQRTQRGGGWQNDSILNRTVARRHNTSDSNYSAWGLRLVLPVQ
jgi:sulfatase modifying factor 1